MQSIWRTLFTPNIYTNRLPIMERTPLSESRSLVPLMTVELFAELIGLPVGVCQAQADRQLWPIVRVGKRRFINVELVRKQALEAGRGKFLE